MMSTKSKLPSGWSLTQLEDICIPKGLVRGPFGGALKKECFVENGYKVYEQKNAIYRDVDLGVYFVDHKLYNSLKRFALKPRDFIVSCSGTIGRIFQIPDNAKEGIINQALLKITTDRNIVDDSYFFQYFDWDRFQSKIIDNTQGGAMQNLVGMDIFRKTEIPLPPLPEQKAIAQVLSTADAAIQTTEKLIAQNELRKKWLMQQLLTGKKRLNGFENTKWKIQPLENFIKPIVREVPKPSTPYLGIGLRSHGKGTFLKYDEQPEKNSMDNFYVVRPNDLIVNITFAWEQAIAIVRPEDDGALASHRFPTYSFIEDKGHPDFFRFYILQPRMKFMLQMISPGGAGRNRVMSKSDFIKLEFLLPDYKEQTAISQVLQAAEKEISLLKTKAEKLRVQKKGLMQQLLTGKVRLKI
jgi:type I restriction enzyme S subunit